MSYSVILHKRTTTTGRTPDVETLSAGELAVNAADGKIFTKTTDNLVKTFVNTNQLPHTLDSSLSSVNFQYGNNTVAGVLSEVLGGIDNNIIGWGSTVLNGSDNDINGDYAFIGNGSNNTIQSGGDYGAIIGGQNNVLDHDSSFILGSNITSHASNFTYVNNLSSTGKIYGDGSELVGIVAGDTEATTLVRQQSAIWGVGGQPQNLSFNETTKDLSLTYGNTISLSSFGTGADTELRAISANWESTYTTFRNTSSTFLTSETDSQTLSFNETTKNLSISNGNTISLSSFGTGADTELRAVSANWETALTTVQANSSSNWDNSAVISYIDSNFLPVSGGTLTGNLSVLGDLVYVDTSVAIVSTMYIDTNTILDPALRITQRGTGDVIRVEDSANPDSTPFIINSDGLVGVGTSSPNEELTVIGNISATGSYYGDGSNLTGIIAGDTIATTLVRTNSANWETTYTTVQTVSASWQTTFQASSAYVSSNPQGITGASALTKMIQITQAGYNSITPASDTLYIIVG